MTNCNDTAGATRARTAVIDAIRAANPFVNYAAYDTNGNGQLSARRAAHHGDHGRLETATCRPLGSVWGYKSGLGPDSPFARRRATRASPTPRSGSSSATASRATRPRSAIIAHELGHDLGWPDLYDTDDSTDDSSRGGVGAWSLMSYGTWTVRPEHQPGERPGASRRVPEVLPGVARRRPRSSGPSPAAPSPRPRPKRPRCGCSTTPAASTGRSAARPGPGSTSWSRTASGSATTARCPPAACCLADRRVATHRRRHAGPNADDQRRLVQLIEADGNSLPFNAGDAWSGARTLNDASTPNSRLVSGASSGVSISNFSACGTTMTADITAPGTPMVATSDAFGAAAGVATLPYQQTGATTASATVEAGEPTPSCGAIGKTVWFRYTPAASGTLIADTIGSGFDTLLAVYRGSSLAGLTQVGCNDDIDNAANNLASKAQFAVTARPDVLRAGRWLQGPERRPGVRSAHVPPDGGAGRAGQRRVRGRRRRRHAAVHARGRSTRVPRRPRPASRPRRARPPPGRAPWFRYAPTASGTLVADTVGSDFDTVLAVHRGTALGALTEVGCNDDIDADNRRSRVQFAVTAGQTYYLQAERLQVHGRHDRGRSADAQRRRRERRRRPNDAFAAAIAADAAAVHARQPRHAHGRRRGGRDQPDLPRARPAPSGSATPPRPTRRWSPTPSAATTTRCSASTAARRSTR